mgnify:CR=1 FL=1
MEADYARLFFNAIFHYWSQGRLYPYEEKNERLPLFDETGVTEPLQFLSLRQRRIFQIQPSHKRSIFLQRDFLWQHGAFMPENPSQNPAEYSEAQFGKVIAAFYKLRNDIKIETFAGKVTKGQAALRKKYPDAFFFCPVQEMFPDLKQHRRRYKGRWIRIGERLHPAEYSEAQFGKVIAAFYKLRRQR